MAASIIQKAFNAGYLIEKYLPKLSQLLVKGFKDKSNPYAEGLIAGSKEMEAERMQGKLKFLQNLKEEFGSKTPSQSKTKNRNDREMDIDI